jgi:secondary thiamine-phosphate synthase enzyme
LHQSDRASDKRSYRKEIRFNVPGRRGLINITPQVDTCFRKSGIPEGLSLVSAMHITASVFINGDERGLHQDYDDWLEDVRSKLRQTPHEPISKYRHNRTGEDNADAHLKRQIMGREVVVAITDGRLDFGPWEQIFQGQAEWLARESRRPAPKTCSGQNHRRIAESRSRTWLSHLLGAGSIGLLWQGLTFPGTCHTILHRITPYLAGGGWLLPSTGGQSVLRTFSEDHNRHNSK